MALSVRIRFEVLKRDDFTCKYCGRRSPEVVLQVDHIIAESDGGTDDPINLTTSCWECNSGKSNVPLVDVITGEDPHDRAILILERERQLREYNALLARVRAQREEDIWDLWGYWQTERGVTDKQKLASGPRRELSWIQNALDHCPKEQIRSFMDYAVFRGFTDDLRYVKGCVRHWREDAAAAPKPDPTMEDEMYEQLREVDRQQTIEEVIRVFRSEEHVRRNVGRCLHDPACESFVACVLLTVEQKLLQGR